ncbi:hypothetical protein L208DRAFT_1383333 [Tricholoma matsutake]|nr:hypothetical protein L208DRAFT_1383333 [Tricholoma matsutake 945]
MSLMINIRLLSNPLHSLSIIAIPILLSQNAAAFPLISMTPRDSKSSLGRRNTNSSSGGVSPQVWVPILAIAFVLALAAVWTCAKRGWWKHLSMFSWGTTPSDASPAQETRELTAEQLAGSINANATSTTTTRARRNRRPRRTPSQISTTSLPAYNKEPGEQELVIFRGPEDMEDAGMPTAVVMPSVSEDGEDSMHSRDESDLYRPMPESPNNEPLLEENALSADQFTQSLQHPEDNMPRRSLATPNSADEASSLMQASDAAPAYSDAPRGEAPAYFEAVDPPEASPQNSATIRETPNQLPPALPRGLPERVSSRRSGFRQLLSALPNRLSMSHNTSHANSSYNHSRADSSLSLVSSDNSHGRETSHGRPSHRPSPSGSGSLLSLAPFRTVSRQSNVNLNSPSMISLDSISAPLTHTLIRTEFTYPKAGPTPEQLKLISSREAFARFGMPYGADAIAYAASASRHDLHVPPPDFNVSDSEISPVPGSSQGPSRLRTISNAEDLAQEQEREQERVPQQESSPDSSAANDMRPAHTSSPQAQETRVHHLSQTENALTSEPASDSARNADNLLTPSASSDISSPDIRPVDLETTAPLSSYKAPTTSDLESKTSSISNTSARLGLGAPSHKVPSIFDRSVSRASSVQTFATAAESMQTDSSQIEPDQNDGHSDTSRSVLPSADATVAGTMTEG